MRWTESEIEILKKYYDYEGGNLSTFIRKSSNALRIKAYRLGLRKLEYRKKIILSPTENQIILGGLLGDLCCRMRIFTKNAFLQGGHCKEQKEYLLWKLNSLKSLSFKTRINKRKAILFDSKSYPCLNIYYNLFYKNNKKIVNLSILNKLYNLGLAVWYMDDGCYKKKDKSCNIHTNGFTYSENLLIKNWFEKKWCIKPKIYSIKKPKDYPGKVWYFLNFNVKETIKLINLIKNHIHPSMNYKIGVLN